MSTPLLTVMSIYFSTLRTRWWQLLSLLFLFPGVIGLIAMQDPARQGPLTWPMEPHALPGGAELACLMFNLILIITWLSNSAGFPTRLYSLPVSTATLVLGWTLPGMLIAGGSHIVVAQLLNWTVNPNWPTLGPALFYALSYGLFMTAVWPYRGREGRQIISAMFVSALLLLWLYGHYTAWRLPSPLSNWQPLWSYPEIEFQIWKGILGRTPQQSEIPMVPGGISGSELMMAAMLLVAGWLWLSRGVQRDRSSANQVAVPSTLSNTPFVELISPQTSKLSGVRQLLPAWRSPAWAVFWAEWRQDGMLVPLAFGGVMTALGLMHTAALLTVRGYRESAFRDPGMLMLPLMICMGLAYLPFFSIVTTQHGIRTQKQLPIPSWYSTLPMSNELLGTIAWLRTWASILLGVALTLLSGAIFAGIHLSLAYAWGAEQSLNLVQELPRRTPDHWLVVGIWITMFWSLAWVGLTTSLTGRRLVAYLPFLSIFGMIVVGIIGAFVPPNLVQGETVMRSCLGLLSGIVLILTLLSLKELRYSRLAFVVVAGIIALYAVWWYQVYPLTLAKSRGEAIVVNLTFVCGLILVTAPSFLMPAAVAWNRHR